METFEADTHGMVVAGAGSTAAGDTTIGQITLPAGGPWTIFQIWALIAAATATAGESYGGHFRLNAASGDVSPNPAPSRFPTGMVGSQLGALNNPLACPLQIFDVDYQAEGKAVLDLIYNEASTVTVATQVVLGVIFGKTRPVKTPFKFSDRIRAAISSAADSSIGTLTLPEGASKITGISCIAVHDGVLTAGEELIGFLRLASDDIKLPPAQYPINAAYAAGLGITMSACNMQPVKIIPVNIPIPGGARVDAYLDLNTALTNAAEVELFVTFE